MRAKTAVALASVAGGLASLAGAVYEGLHYSDWANPGALGWMVRLAGAALVLFAVPAVMIAVWVFRQFEAQARALGLTPGQAALAQFALTEVVHHEWVEYNRERSAQLTESVMGRVRE